MQSVVVVAEGSTTSSTMPGVNRPLEPAGQLAAQFSSEGGGSGFVAAVLLERLREHRAAKLMVTAAASLTSTTTVGHAEPSPRQRDLLFMAMAAPPCRFLVITVNRGTCAAAQMRTAIWHHRTNPVDLLFAAGR